MNEMNEILARRAIEANRLSRDQADQLLEEARRTGRSFRDIALGRGLLSAQDLEHRPPKKVETFKIVMMFGGLMAFMILVLAATRYFQEQRQARSELARARAAVQSSAPGIALSSYTAYLDLKPEDADVFVERARLYRRLRKVDLAIADYQRAAKLNPALAPSIKTEIDSLRQTSGPK